LELFPDSKQFVFRQGDLIAYSGNTGGSTGPHLHFEIRDGKTEEPLELVQETINIQDTVPPKIYSLTIFPLHWSGTVNDLCYNKNVPLRLNSKDKIYAAADSQRIALFGAIGFGLETEDRQMQDGASLGIKSIEMFLDSEKVYEYFFERFRYDDTRYVNANIDYAAYFLRRQSVILCYKQYGNFFKSIREKILSGILDFDTVGNHTVRFKVHDFSENISEAVFNFIAPYNETDEAKTCHEESSPDSVRHLRYQHHIDYQSDMVKFNNPETPIVYDQKWMVFSERPSDKNLFSIVFHAGSDTVAMHSACDLSIRPEKLPVIHNSKALIVKVDLSGRYYSAGGSINNGWVTTRVNSFGDYAVAVDTVPPEIKATNLSTRGKDAVIKFKIIIYEDLSGIATYRATLNKKWMLMEYDAKTGTLTGQEKVTKKNATYRFQLVVTDKKGNRSKYSAVMKY